MTINGCYAHSKELNIPQRDTFQGWASEKFGKFNKQAGGKLFKARRQEIWKNERYSYLKKHKIWGNVTTCLVS